MQSIMDKIQPEAVEEIIREAGRLFADRHAAEHRKTKGVADYVTDVDLAVQSFIRKKLGLLYPDIQFMGEEMDNREVDLNAPLWVLDPVDGTTNLIHDYRSSAVSLAILEHGEPVFGIIYQPYLKEMYRAQKGGGSFCNGEPIHVSNASTLEESLIVIGTSPYEKNLAGELFPIFRRIFEKSQDIRRSGSAAIDLANVAAGRAEGFFEKNLKLWDYAAGMLLVREAGGRMLDWNGCELEARRVSGVVAGNASVAGLLIEQIKKVLFS